MKATTGPEGMSEDNTLSIGESIDDNAIEVKAEVNISKASKNLANARIKAQSYNGRVLLVGQVATEADKALATATVKKINNVNNVYNQLTVGKPIPLKVQSADSWISTKIHYKFNFETTADTSNIIVLTENGVVYLIGQLRPTDKSELIELVKTVEGTQKVIAILEESKS